MALAAVARHLIKSVAMVVVPMTEGYISAQTELAFPMEPQNIVKSCIILQHVFTQVNVRISMYVGATLGAAILMIFNSR